MADITIYVPEQLRARIRAAHLPVSSICRQALLRALEQDTQLAAPPTSRARGSRRP